MVNNISFSRLIYFAVINFTQVLNFTAWPINIHITLPYLRRTKLFPRKNVRHRAGRQCYPGALHINPALKKRGKGGANFYDLVSTFRGKNLAKVSQKGSKLRYVNCREIPVF